MTNKPIVPNGYKQTKVGVIPLDWNVIFLNEKTKIQRGRFSPRPRNDPQYYGGNIPFVQTNDIVSSKGKIEKYSQTLNESGLRVSKLFPKGTILMTIAANIGFTGIIEIDMACPDSLIGIQCENDLHNEFLNYYFIFNQPKIDYLAEEATQKNINLLTVNKIKIPLPPLKEQKKIAKILSFWSNAISKQEELIKTKEENKKGLMQKLLSGEIRFDGFNGKWKKVKLFEIAKKMQSGGTPLTSNKSYYKGDIPFVKVNDITKAGKYLLSTNVSINKEALNNSSAWLVPMDSLIYSMYASVGFVSINKIEVATSQAMINIIPNEKKVNLEYLYYCLLNFKKYIHKYVKTGTQRNLSTHTVKHFYIHSPSLKEQQKIAGVLTITEQKIELLKSELIELKEQKKALMQKLLTGEIRVKV